MKILPLLLCGLFPGLAFAENTPQPSKEKVDQFATKLSKACQDYDLKGIKELSCFDEAPACLVDWSVYTWEMIFEMSKKNRKFKDAKFISMEEELTKPNVNVEGLKWMVDPQIKNGHRYVRNLPVVGFAEVNFVTTDEHASEMGNVTPVGLDRNGDLKFPEWKRVDVSAGPTPLPPRSAPAISSVQKTVPREKAVEDFTELLKQAAQDPENTCASVPLFYTQGVPEELVDYELDAWKLIFLSSFTREKATIEEVKFTPLEEFFSKPGADRSQQETLIKGETRNGRRYHTSLPVTGMVTISMKSEKSTGILTRHAGITPDGALRFGIPAPEGNGPK